MQCSQEICLQLWSLTSLRIQERDQTKNDQHLVGSRSSHVLHTRTSRQPYARCHHELSYYALDSRGGYCQLKCECVMEWQTMDSLKKFAANVFRFKEFFLLLTSSSPNFSSLKF